MAKISISKASTCSRSDEQQKYEWKVQQIC